MAHFGSWTIPYFPHSFLFPLFRYKLIFSSSVHFFIFLFKRFIPCAKFSVLLVCRLWHTSLPPGGYWSSERILLGHPPLWFSVIFQSFWCSWAHQSIPSLRIYLIVDLTTCNDFAASLMGLFWFFRQMIACFSGSDYSWDFLLR